jgi:hypothetical protein
MQESLFNKKYGKQTLFYLPDAYKSTYTNELDEESMKDVVKCYFLSVQTPDLTWITTDFPSLAMIQLEKSKKLTSLNGIQGLSQLKNISIKSSCESLTDYSALANPNLTSISLDDVLADLPVLSENLENLSIQNCKNLKNLDFMANLKDDVRIVFRGLSADLPLPSRFNNPTNLIK